jgi:hypothetical protein
MRRCTNAGSGSPLAELDSALLLIRHLLKRIHFAFDTTKLRSVSPVAADEEGRGPEHDDSRVPRRGFFGSQGTAADRLRWPPRIPILAAEDGPP